MRAYSEDIDWIKEWGDDYDAAEDVVDRLPTPAERMDKWAMTENPKDMFPTKEEYVSWQEELMHWSMED